MYVGSPCSDEQQKLGLPANLDSYGRCGWTLCGRTTEFAYETVLACTASSYQAADLRLPEGDWVKLEFTGPESVYQLTLCDVAVWGGVRGFDPNCQGGSCILTPAKYSAAANIEGSVSEASDSGQSNSVLNVLPLALAGVAGVLALALVALGVRYKSVFTGIHAASTHSRTHSQPRFVPLFLPAQIILLKCFHSKPASHRMSNPRPKPTSSQWTEARQMRASQLRKRERMSGCWSLSAKRSDELI